MTYAHIRQVSKQGPGPIRGGSMEDFWSSTDRSEIKVLTNTY